MQANSVSEYPIYVRIPTEGNRPYFENKSSAEAVIGVLIAAQNQGWLRLHGFVVLPDSLEIVMSPIRQKVSGVIAHLQAEMIPLLSVLLPQATYIWDRQYNHDTIKTAQSLSARLDMLLLAPVALGISDSAEGYPYSSANPRYKANIANYAGFSKPVLPEHPVLANGAAAEGQDKATSTNGVSQTSPDTGKSNGETTSGSVSGEENQTTA